MRNITFILLLIIQNVYGQSDLLHFEAAGLPGSELKVISQDRLETVYTSGGYINLHRPDLSDKLYYRTSDNMRISGMLYLLPNKEYTVDILDRKTDTLVQRYCFKRPKLVPLIRFYRQGTPFYTFPVNLASELWVSPGEKITFSVAERGDFEHMEAEYTLVNLKTGGKKHGTLKTGLAPLTFTANTDYGLVVNYVVQQENTATFYIHVKPYWYRTTSAYIIGALVLTGLILITIILVFIMKVRASQRAQQKLHQAAIRLQSLLNPHFTFNALSSIQGLMNTGRIEEANNYLQEFSALLRQTLAKSEHVFNSLDQELDMMRMYLRLEALRFNFSWDIIISPALNTSTIEIPTLLLQPLIENAIKHGLQGLGDKGQLMIICKETAEPDSFFIVVKDNGSWLDNSQHTGYGLSLTTERIQTINKLRKEQSIQLSFNKENGTEAILLFHNWLN